MKEIAILNNFVPTLLQDKNVAIGPGDDCAALDLGLSELILVAVDQVISDVHYTKDTTTPEQAAAKLLKRNLSDIAAMGGTPSWALLALAASNTEENWFNKFYNGLREACNTYNVSLCGGDLAFFPDIKEREIGSLTIMGTVPKDRVCQRSGAKPNDFVVVTGTLGNSFASNHHLNFIPRLAEGRFLAQNDFCNAMIDISDGLLLDAKRLALMSELGIKLDLEAIPKSPGASLTQALSDGEDYELLFTVSGDKIAQLLDLWPYSTKLTIIGQCQANPVGQVVDQELNSLTDKYKAGYEHVSS